MLRSFAHEKKSSYEKTRKNRDNDKRHFYAHRIIYPTLRNDTQFLHWHCKTSAFAEKPRVWSMKQLAECICEFDVILQKTLQANDAPAEKFPHEITVFQAFMISVYKEAEIALHETLQSSRTNIGTQKGQGRLQDNMDITGYDNNTFDLNNCAYCKHRFVVPIGMDIVERNKHNTKVESEYHVKMEKWNTTSTVKRGAKPRPGKLLTQHLACICVKMNCLDKTNGSGCFKCEIACDNAIEQGSDVRPYFNANFECTCHICKCECSVIYYRHEANKVSRQRKIDKEKANQTMSQPKLDSFYGFTNALANISREQLIDVEDADEAMALTAIDLTSSNSLSQNINLRNTLQKSIGPLKTSSNGLSVAQLRAAKREKRKMNINQQTAALPLDNGGFFMILTQLFLNQSLQHCRLELMIIVDIIEIVCMKKRC